MGHYQSTRKAECIKSEDALYCIMTGKPFDGKKAAAMGLENESVPQAQLRQHTQALRCILMEKNPAAIKAAKNAFKRTQGLPWDTSEDNLFSKQEQLWAIAGHAREERFKQFLDDKTYRPGLGVYQKPAKS
jgi:feruloyl-CoA hydratase/lyase